MKKKLQLLLQVVFGVLVIVFYSCEDPVQLTNEKDIADTTDKDSLIVIDKDTVILSEEDTLGISEDNPNEIITVLNDQAQVITTIDSLVRADSDVEFKLNKIINSLLADINKLVRDSTGESDCPSIVIEHKNKNKKFPRIITKTFSESCTDEFGNPQRGVVIITDNNKPSQSDSKRIIEFIDYQIGNYTINGVNTIAKKGINENGELIIRDKESFKIEKPNGKVVYRITNKKKYRLDERDADNNLLSRTRRITGTMYVIKSNGLAYKMKINNNSLIHRTNDCKWPLSGIKNYILFKDPKEINKQIELYPELFSASDLKILKFKKDIVFEINFGEKGSECDNIATKTINNGESVEFRLKRQD